MHWRQQLPVDVFKKREPLIVSCSLFLCCRYRLDNAAAKSGAHWFQIVWNYYERQCIPSDTKLKKRGDRYDWVCFREK